MADMAEIGQVEDCWEQLVKFGITDETGSGITPVTYMNSSAAIKAFCGERDGVSHVRMPARSRGGARVRLVPGRPASSCRHVPD